MAWTQRDMSAPDDMHSYEDDIAECVVCGEHKMVCCDTGYHEDTETGRIVHDDPKCAECCRLGPDAP